MSEQPFNEYGELPNNEAQKSKFRRWFEGQGEMVKWGIRMVRTGELWRRYLPSSYTTKSTDNFREKIDRSMPVKVDENGNLVQIELKPDLDNLLDNLKEKL